MKKDETRFTIRFNMADPRQQRAMQALEASGRRKATLISDAVCEYLAQHGENAEASACIIIPSPAIFLQPKNEIPKNDFE
jgi:hypothetical protein